MLTIPFPPSVNQIWRQYNGRVILSARGRQYRISVGKVVALHREARVWPFLDDLSVGIRAYCPDARRRDLDNLLKASLDGLTAAGIWADDSQIKKLTIEHCGIDRANPRLEVEVTV